MASIENENVGKPTDRNLSLPALGSYIALGIIHREKAMLPNKLPKLVSVQYVGS